MPDSNRKTFSDLSLHQKMRFLHDFHVRFRAHLPERKTEFLGANEAEDEEILKGCSIYRAFLFSQHEDTRQIVQGICRRLDPVNRIDLPPKLDCQSVLMILLVHLFNQYYPVLDPSRLIDLTKVALMQLGSINTAEALKLKEVVKFEAKQKALYVTLQDKKVMLQLTPLNDCGFEVKVLSERQVSTVLRPIIRAN